MLRFFSNKKIGKTGGFLLAIALAAAIGGLTGGFVRASIPDGNGTIHGCYSTGRGSLYIIDNSSQSCGTGETGLNWNQNGVLLHDADGQTLGSVVGYGYDTGVASPQSIYVYNSTLNRVIFLNWDGDNSKMAVGAQTNPLFESNDCSGQAYIDDSPGIVSIKTALLRWRVGSTDHYGTVSNAATASSITFHSTRNSDDGSCVETSDTRDQYPITSATVPFDMPLTMPLKF